MRTWILTKFFLEISSNHLTIEKLGKMSNFRHILFLIIFICVEVQFIAYCEESEPVQKYYWEVEENEINVEAKVIQYAQQKTISPTCKYRRYLWTLKQAIFKEWCVRQYEKDSSSRNWVTTKFILYRKFVIKWDQEQPSNYKIYWDIAFKNFKSNIMSWKLYYSKSDILILTLSLIFICHAITKKFF